jgi:hypothetical protein
MTIDLDLDIGVATTLGPEDFRHRAACRGVDPELFFPTAESGPIYDAQVSAAKAVCAGCPVRAQCLAWALTALPYGVAGGLTEHERHQARTRRSRRRTTRTGCRPAGATRSEVAAAGRAAIAAGANPQQLAREFGVSERTTQRWAHDTAGAGRGAPAATGLPSGSPSSTNPLAGTRTVEGHRS